MHKIHNFLEKFKNVPQKKIKSFRQNKKYAVNSVLRNVALRKVKLSNTGSSFLLKILKKDSFEIKNIHKQKPHTQFQK